MERYEIPLIEMESSSGIRTVPLSTYHLMNRRMFLRGTIDHELANEFVSQFLFLAAEEKPITIYIDSVGGEIQAGLVIYDVLVSSSVPVDMVCVGRAYSMAAFLLAAGQKGRRYILPHSNVMIHEPRLLNGVGGTATSIQNMSESIWKMRKTMNEILAKHTGRTLKEVEKAMAYDHYMSAEESIAFGICDKILEGLGG